MKLVRDKIPQLIKGDGQWCLMRTVSDSDEHANLLRDKIIEEADEFVAEPSYEEAADMLEVLRAFCHLNNLDWRQVVKAADKKQYTHGGFFRGIVLQEVGKNESG